MSYECKYRFIAIVSLLNQQALCSFEYLRNRLGLSDELFLEQLHIIKQLFATQIRLLSDKIELLTPIALFRNEDFFEFNHQQLWQVEVIDTCLSTNTLLLNRVKEEVKENINYRVLIANEQIKGRGRRQKSWYSELGKSLTFSLTWQVLKGQDIQTIPLIIAVAIGRTLQQFGLDFKIKWPNDIVVGQKKLAGILVENTDYQHNKVLVIGIGINFNLASNREHISLLELNANIHPKSFLIALLWQIEQVLKCHSNSGFKYFQAEFNYWHRDIYKRVCLIFNQQVVLQGTVEGIASNGALLIRGDNNQLQQVTSSAFSLQLLDD